MPGVPPAIDAAGRMRLPDGRLARLHEAHVRAAGGVDIGSDIAHAVQHLRTNAWGYTIVGADATNRPVIQVWLQGPIAYGGMCGNSSAASRRRGFMQVWRNAGAFAAQRGSPGYTGAAYAEPVSVLDH
jgi:hypothetical protein